MVAPFTKGAAIRRRRWYRARLGPGVVGWPRVRRADADSGRTSRWGARGAGASRIGGAQWSFDETRCGAAGGPASVPDRWIPVQFRAGAERGWVSCGIGG